MNERLAALATLIRKGDAIDREIAVLLGRPALAGHVGEFIAAAVFGIDLAASPVNKGSDGVFAGGPLAGRSVNVKWYTAFCGLLDVNPAALPEFYLVLAGPRYPAGSSRGRVLPWVIRSVYLFEAEPLIRALEERGVKIGVATSVLARQWEEAEIFPGSRNALLALSPEQRQMLGRFHG